MDMGSPINTRSHFDHRNHIDTRRNSDIGNLADLGTTPDNRTAILLVDDEESIRTFIESALGPQGFKILTAKDGMEGLQLFRQYPGQIRLVITDVMMPRMTGVEMAEAIRATSADMKIIFMSGVAAGTAILKTLRERSYFLPKPLSIPNLISSIEYVLAA